ncbi:MAG: hypothetical protein HN341_04385 [Verrucomicrobia bacterium]|jgi:hypothetical protein|nr:hypothetical protein [Verrucomicrobiota bacterium]
MLGFMLGDIFVSAAILCVILHLVAKHESDYSFAKVAMVTAAISLGGFLIQVFLFERIGWFTIGLVFVLAMFMIMTFCWVRFWKALLIVTLFCLFHTGIRVGIKGITGALFAGAQPQQQTPRSSRVSDLAASEAEWKEAREGLVLSGTMSSDLGGYTAMVNGEVVDVGDTVSIQDRKRTFLWRVHSISKHDIEYERIGTQSK